MKTRPIIGITPSFETEQDFYRSNNDYADMVYLSGGEPVILPYDFNSVEILSGLLFSGGGDIAAETAGYLDGETLTFVVQRRDEQEKRLFVASQRLQLPVLGICRGCQLVNLLSGGTLHRDIAEAGFAENHQLADGSCHTVSCLPSSLAAKMLGETGSVISTHHQAVAQPGRGFKVTARSPEGVVECIEHEGGLMLGLQTHPERMRLAAPFDWLMGLIK